jgi:Ni/Co efflux regulator RcnB
MAPILISAHQFFIRKDITMKKILTAALALTLLAGTGSAFAQGNDNRDRGHDSMHGPSMGGPGMAMHGPAPAHDWHQGDKIGHDDWGRGQKIDYRQHHLRKPPRGYEWRQVDNNYILAAAATGLIASVILAGH